MPISNTDISLEVLSLTKRFKSFTAVNDLTIKINQGEIVALLGPNGAGKTTLIRMLAGILKPSSGSVIIKSLQDFPISKLHKYIGYCPQRKIIWKDLSCFEQLYFVGLAQGVKKENITKQAHQLLETFNLQNETHKLAKNLSGGMQQRLNIAISMIHRPTILLLDEPEAGLDPQSRVFLRETLQSLSKESGTTILVSTHNIEEADRISERVAIMNKGELIAFDTQTSLKNNAGKSHLLEITFPALDSNLYAQIKSRVQQPGIQINVFAKTIFLDADENGAIVKLVKETLHQLGITPIDFKFRQRTLEDVFIALTGKRLMP